MAQLTWEAMTPIDTSRYLDAIQKAQAQSVAGVEQIGNAYKGYYDNLKKQNTNDMLTALNQAQNPEQLAAAQANIAAMQQRWGSGYDMDSVRTAMDERPAVLNQRDMQAIQYQQAKAQNDAIPMVNEAMAGLVNSRQGITPEQQALVSKIAQAGYDTTGIVNTIGNTVVGDFRDNRTYTTGRSDRAEDVQWRKDQATQQQNNWQADYDYREDESNWKRADDVSKDYPKENALSFQDGKWVTTANPGISRMDAYGALSGVRGIRNNNPGNIEFYNQPGASLESKGGRFASFSTPEQGINAMSKQLDLYYTGKSRNVTKPINTIQDIITTWAPPKNKKGQVENNTPAYIAAVAKSMGVSPTAKLNLNDPNTKAALMSAMITHENGGNPYTQQQYIAGITGNTSTAAAASNAIQIPQAAAAKAVSGYNTAITELNNKFNLQTTQDQAKTGLGTKGQTIDSWLISKSTKDREGSTLITDYSSKVAKLARNNAKLSNLPMGDQIRVLDAAHAWALTPGGVITDKHLDRRITNLATSLIDGKKHEHEQGKKNIFEAQYQAFVKELNAAGMGAVSRDAFRQLVSPETAPKPSKATPETPPAYQSSKPAATAPSAAKTATATAATAAVASAAAKPKPAPNTANQVVIPFANPASPSSVASTLAKANSNVATKTTPTKTAPKAETKVAKPSKQDVVAFYVKRGEVSNVAPDGINSRTDRQLIREAQAEAAKQLAAKEAKQKEATERLKATETKEKAAKEAKKASEHAEREKMRIATAEREKQRIAKERLKLAEERKAKAKQKSDQQKKLEAIFTNASKAGNEEAKKRFYTK